MGRFGVVDQLKRSCLCESDPTSTRLASKSTHGVSKIGVDIKDTFFFMSHILFDSNLLLHPLL